MRTKWIVSVFTVSACFFETQAGTYNFFFNNSEQGANSVAKPEIVVQGGEPKATKEIESSSGLESSTPVEQSTQTVAVETPSERGRDFPIVKMGLALIHVNETYEVENVYRNYWESSGYSYKREDQNNRYYGVDLALDIFPARQIAFQVFGGHYWGAGLKGYPFVGPEGPVYLGLGLGVGQTSLLLGKLTPFYEGEVGVALNKSWGIHFKARNSLTLAGLPPRYLTLGAGLHVKF